MWLACLALLLTLRAFVGKRRQLATTPSVAMSAGPSKIAGSSRLPAGHTPAVNARGAALLHHQGLLPLDRFLILVLHEWEQLGLGQQRLLSKGELDMLARKAGFRRGLLPSQPPLAPAPLQLFAAWFERQLDLVEALRPLFACTQAQLVGGFDVCRTQAVRALQAHAAGTFCLRMGSLEGHLVVSMVVKDGGGGSSGSSGGGDSTGSGSGSFDEHQHQQHGQRQEHHQQQQQQRRVSHYLFSAARLRMSGLQRVLAEVPGCYRLLDVSSGEVVRPKSALRLVEKMAAQLA